MNHQQTTRVRAEGVPSHLPAHMIPTPAEQLLRALLDDVDVVDRARGKAFLLVTVSQRVLDQLARFEAHLEDAEPEDEGDELDRGEWGVDDEGEPDADGEASNVTAVGADLNGANDGRDLELGVGPSPEAVEAARQRWHDRGRPSTWDTDNTPSNDPKRLRNLVRLGRGW